MKILPELIKFKNTSISKLFLKRYVGTLGRASGLLKPSELAFTVGSISPGGGGLPNKYDGDDCQNC